MEIKEALNILDQVCAVHQGVRAEHVALQQAIQVVRDATTPPVDADPLDSTEEKEKEKEKEKESDGNKK